MTDPTLTARTTDAHKKIHEAWLAARTQYPTQPPHPVTTPMSDERLARLNADNEPRGDHLSGLTADEVDELLDEVDRLRTEAAYMREQIEQQAQVIEERKMQTVAYRALADGHQKRGDKLSARLAEHPSQWEVRRAYPNGNTIVLVGLDETQARVELAENGGVLFERCAAGEWREVPNA